jgi:Na+/H+ antiporter NhaD/arsenite permease-like protein
MIVNTMRRVRSRTITQIITAIISSVALSAWSAPVFSSTGTAALTDNWLSYLCIAIFIVAYVLVILEENLHLRKSKPMLVAAGMIWILVAIILRLNGDTETARQAVTHNLLEYGELFLFLLAAMAYINAMDERGVFDALRAWMVTRRFSLRTIYWLTGALAFSISPVADNLTTALLMATVVMAVGGAQTKFVTVGCINIVVAANAGGAFSPFGDITTLMVWQKGIVPFQDFFSLFFPSLINWLIPAVIMFTVVPRGKPEAMQAQAQVLDGA